MDSTRKRCKHFFQKKNSDSRNRLLAKNWWLNGSFSLSHWSPPIPPKPLITSAYFFQVYELFLKKDKILLKPLSKLCQLHRRKTFQLPAINYSCQIKLDKGIKSTHYYIIPIYKAFTTFNKYSKLEHQYYSQLENNEETIYVTIFIRRLQSNE